MNRMLDYFYILTTIVCTVYGQLILKWRLNQFSNYPENLIDKIRFLVGLLIDPFILSGFLAAFLASVAWMGAMTKFDLSHAYPFMSLNFVIVVVLSAWLLAEPVGFQKIIGVAMIVIGTIIAARG